MRSRLAWLVLLVALSPFAHATIRIYQWRVLDSSADPSARVPRFYVTSTLVELTGSVGGQPGDTAYVLANGLAYYYTGSSWLPVADAPVTSKYLLQQPDAFLPNAQSMSALGTGLVLSTTTTGVQSIYAGTSCANQFPRSLNASGAATCASVADADISAVATTKLTGTITDAQLANNYSGVGTCTNQFARALNDNAAPTCATVVLGTDTSGNYAAGNGVAGAATTGDSATAFFAAGQIEAARGGTGIDSSASTGVWRSSSGTWSANAGVSHLAASTSADLRGVLSDETGTGAAMFSLTTAMANDIGCTGSQSIARNAGNTAWECVTAAGGSGLSHPQVMARLAVGGAF